LKATYQCLVGNTFATDAEIHRVRKNGTNNVLGITLTNTNVEL